VGEEALDLQPDDDFSHMIMRNFDNDLNESLGFDEFCVIYEEILTRVELTRFCTEMYTSMHIDSSQCLLKEEVDSLIEGVAVFFKKLGCTDKELSNIKTKLLSEYEDNEGKIYQDDLQGLFDGMAISLRLIRKAEAKFRELDVNNSGFLEEGELLALSEWVVHACSSKYGQISDTEKHEMLMKLMKSYDRDSDGRLNLMEVSVLFESVMERKKWVQLLNNFENKPGAVTTDHRRRRLSHYSFNDLSEEDLLQMGIAPIARVKFNELDTLKKGTIGKAEIKDLITWALISYHKVIGKEFTSDPEFIFQRDEILHGFEQDLENPLVYNYTITIFACCCYCVYLLYLGFRGVLCFV
jgi:Ca2+-binding EF-hand superfamily protein